MKVGIMGGTFNPIHQGHIEICEKALKEYKLDKVLFVPNKIPPHKELNDFYHYDKHRIEMIKKAIEDHKDFYISLVEINRKDKSYMIDTIKILKNENSKETFYLILGDDSLFNIEKWKDFKDILKNVKVLVGIREKTIKEIENFIEYLKENYVCDILIIHNEIIDISSTDIRDNKKDDKISKDYIKKNKLYN